MKAHVSFVPSFQLARAKNPALVLARLQLAKLLWQLDCAPFALEQLQQIFQLTQSSSNEALKQLIQRLGGTIGSDLGEKDSGADAKTLASADFDVEVLGKGL